AGGGSAGPGGGGGGGGPAASRAMQFAPPVLAATGTGAPRIEARGQPAASVQPAPRIVLKSIEDVIALAEKNREIQFKIALERDVRLVGFEQGRIEFALVEGGSRTLPNDLARKLQDWTGDRWIVALSQEAGAPTIRERREAAEQQKITGVRAEPLVQAILDFYPGAQIVAIRDGNEAPPPAPVERDDGEPDLDLDALSEYGDDDL
ncbi:MAG: DNA polymerase III subunit gamma/tau, partial [Beijerinckiaceae bacterium]